MAYRRIASREIYRNPWIGVQVHQIEHPDGASGEHLLVVTPAASAVVVDDGGDLLFARQPRFGADTDVLELVKGGAAPDESALDCAKRELREELGVVATQWEPMGMLMEIPSIVSQSVNVFLARGIEHVLDEPEDVERIELVRVPAREAIGAAAAGKIDDAVTVAALLRYGIATGILGLK
ncbi:MAG TPA: NUDIX hydrolase [Verrucomicrobiae bacterium]|jgi:8-oxo-dGTP pyrophosphatase MutT (NUDIX family)|nr:NUDIX hydrolase [Verrucomicrobiae bacterium]